VTNVQGCDLPEELYYDVDDNTWVRMDRDGLVTLGVTSYAVSLSGQIISYRPKSVGREIKRGRAAATIESNLWVGPVTSPISGEIAATNPDLVNNPGLINEAPYSYGWIVKLRPLDWEADSDRLVRGAEAVDAFQSKMQSDGFGAC
jgi:glycine cleavage system H protein